MVLREVPAMHPRDSPPVTRGMREENSCSNDILEGGAESLECGRDLVQDVDCLGGGVGYFALAISPRSHHEPVGVHRGGAADEDMGAGASGPAIPVGGGG